MSLGERILNVGNTPPPKYSLHRSIFINQPTNKSPKIKELIIADKQNKY